MVDSRHDLEGTTHLGVIKVKHRYGNKNETCTIRLDSRGAIVQLLDKTITKSAMIGLSRAQVKMVYAALRRLMKAYPEDWPVG